MKLRGFITVAASIALAAAFVACDRPSAPTRPDIPVPRFAKPDNPGGGGGGGGKGGGETVFYEVRMSSVGAVEAELLTTAACGGYGYVLAMEDGNRLVHDELPDPEPLLLDLDKTQVMWTRLHDVGKGLSGSFDDGCYGETGWEDGSLQIYFEKNRGQRTIRFTWHFDYDLDGLREHFTLLSGKLPLPSGWGDGFEGTGVIEGPMELKYYLKEGNETGRYHLIEEVPFRFELMITRRS